MPIRIFIEWSLLSHIAVRLDITLLPSISSVSTRAFAFVQPEEAPVSRLPYSAMRQTRLIGFK